MQRSNQPIKKVESTVVNNLVWIVEHMDMFLLKGRPEYKEEKTKRALLFIFGKHNNLFIEARRI